MPSDHRDSDGMPATHADRACFGAKPGRGIDLREIEKICGLPRPALDRVPSVADGLVQASSRSDQSQGEITPGAGVLGTAGYGVSKKQPRPLRPPALKLAQRSAEAAPDDAVPPDSPCGMLSQTELTVVAGASAGSGKNMVGDLSSAVGLCAFRPGRQPLAPGAKRQLDLPRRGGWRDAKRPVVAQPARVIGMHGHSASKSSAWRKNRLCPHHPLRSHSPQIKTARLESRRCTPPAQPRRPPFLTATGGRARTLDFTACATVCKGL